MLAKTKRVVIFPTPIETRWTSFRLRRMCKELLGEPIDESTAVIFHSRTRRTLTLLISAGSDNRGTIRIWKTLERGAFLLPAPEAGEAYASVPPSKVKTLLRE